MLLQNTSRKPYPVYRMEPLSISSKAPDWKFSVTIFLTLNKSETTQDRDIVTIEHQEEVIRSVSNGDIFNDLHGPFSQFSRSQHI